MGNILPHTRPLFVVKIMWKDMVFYIAPQMRERVHVYFVLAVHTHTRLYVWCVLINLI